MHKQKVFFFLCFWLCMIGFVSSQVSISPTIGCAPLQVNYSAPPGAASWNFGDLTNPITVPSGIKTYATPGVYVVTYNGIAGAFTQTVTVMANNLSPSFTYQLPPSGCAPRCVTLTATGAGPGGLYQWVYGDGGFGTGSVSTYCYPLAGVFSPTLTVVSQANCAATIAYAGFTVSVSNPANLVISSSDGFASCEAPFASSFSASNSASGSPLGPAMSYTWNFGNNITSNQVTPGSISYTQQTVYTISLTATDDNNCTTTTTSLVSVVEPTVSVSGVTVNCIAPQSTNSAQYFQVSSSQPEVLIDMGDGNPPFFVVINSAVTTFSYPLSPTSGNRTITATVSAGTCVAVATHTYLVEEVIPTFTTTAPFFTCSPVFIRPYINQTTVNSNASLSYSWEVRGYNGDPDPANYSNTTNPTFTFVQGSTNPYTVFDIYKPMVTLLVASSSGCRTYAEAKKDSLARPTALFNKTKSQGCVPLTVTLRDSSKVHPLYPMQSYTWSNGATPPVYQSGVVPPAIINPTFVYNQTGTYTPSYTISTAGGCGDISYVDTIIVVSPPSPSVSFPSPASFCAGNPVTFNLSSSPANSLVTYWHVETDNGFFSGCITDPNPTFPFTHLGVHNITVTASGHGCGATLTPVQTVTVNGPVGKFSYRNSCINKTTVTFYPYLRNAENATLFFGDGQSASLIGNANGVVSFTNTHVYANSGDYVATLTSNNSLTNCQYNYTTMISVRQLSADVSVPLVTCKDVEISFLSTSTDVDPGCGKGYSWYLDNYPPVQTTQSSFMSDSLKTVGTHTITLVVKDVNGCKSMVTKTFRVASPDVDFTFNSNPACVSGNPVAIINLTPQTPDVVDNYTVSFGDMSPNLDLFSPSDWPVLHTYDLPDFFSTLTYTVKIWGSDVNGCRDSMEHSLKVNEPIPQLFPVNRKVCLGDPVIFYSNGNQSYTTTMSYGDGQTQIDNIGPSSYYHAYASPATYTISLFVVDDGGCTAFLQNTAIVEANPSTDFIFQDALGNFNSSNRFCTPVAISCSSTSVPALNSPITSYSWNYGGGVPVVNQPVVATSFSVPGIYTVTLASITGNGCKSSITHSLVIMTVTANPQIDRSRLCVGESVKLSIKDTTSVQQWSWNFHDNKPEVSFSALANPTSTFTYAYTDYPLPNGVTMITLYYSAGEGVFGCSDTKTIAIQVVKVESDFGRNLELSQVDYEHCVNITDQFENRSKHNNSNILSGLRFLWGFGNGATSTVQSSSYTYPQPGVYVVTLTVTDAQLGCTHSASKSMTINPLPTATVSASDSVCRSSSLSLFSTGSSDIVAYNWMPATGVVNPHLANTTATANASTTYSIEVENKFGCKAYSSNTASVYVQQPPLSQYWDTTIVIGQNTILNTNQGPGYTYTWTPLTDLSCSSCAYPISTSTNNITYTVEVMDPMLCFKTISTYSILVDPLTSVDVPTAFTPNGDGVNDVIYVDGWGIKRLLFFRIFNRWGQVIFESSDIKIGWDGTYNGVPQNMETYIYQVSVETYIPGKNMEKTSSFKLIR